MDGAYFAETEWGPEEKVWFRSLAEGGWVIHARKSDYGDRVEFSYQKPEGDERQALSFHRSDNLRGEDGGPEGYPSAEAALVLMASLWEELPRRKVGEILENREYSLAFHANERGLLKGMTDGR